MPEHQLAQQPIQKYHSYDISYWNMNSLKYYLQNGDY